MEQQNPFKYVGLRLWNHILQNGNTRSVLRTQCPSLIQSQFVWNGNHRFMAKIIFIINWRNNEDNCYSRLSSIGLFAPPIWGFVPERHSPKWKAADDGSFAPNYEYDAVSVVRQVELNTLPTLPKWAHEHWCWCSCVQLTMRIMYADEIQMRNVESYDMHFLLSCNRTSWLKS